MANAMWVPRSLKRDGPRYLAIADAIQQDVASGRLGAGAQLPPQRELADRLGLDFTTISRAYSEARRRGLVVGHVGRGTFVRPPAESHAHAEAIGPGGVIDLTANVPVQRVVVAAGDAMARTLPKIPADALHRLFGYGRNAGSDSHRAAGADWIARHDVPATPERIAITNGAQHGLAVILMALLRPGDIIAAESLNYSGLKGVADLLGARIEGIAGDEQGIIPDALRAACARPRDGGRIKIVVCAPTIHNPTGSVMPTSRRQEIAAIAREHDLTLVEDDTYGLLVRSAPRPLASLAPERSYYIAGLSKGVAPGLRIAYVLAPTSTDVARLADAIRLTTWMAVPLMAEVAARWIGDGTADRILDINRQATAERQTLARAMLSRWRIRSHPEAFHLWLELPAPWTGAQLALDARQRGVLVTPAEAFAVGGATAPAAVRVSLCSPADMPALEQALGVIGRLLDLGPGTGIAML
jgi:DNA-binding transcriptional MocR family regulator